MLHGRQAHDVPSEHSEWRLPFGSAQRNLGQDGLRPQLAWRRLRSRPGLRRLPCPRLLGFPEAHSIIYTDGSATGKNSEDGTAACKTGSGLYRAQPLLELCVDPCGLGPTNTITRAELLAIYSSLQHAGPADCVIATDSQASMFMVRKQLTAPGKNAYSTHSLLLAAIADELTSRALAGHGTRIIKVKSHTGVYGNEKADGLANAARLPANCAERVDLGNVAHRGQFWPALVKKDTRQMVSNLCNGIKAHLGAHARGLANHTQYECFWDRVLPELHALSFAFWTSASVRDAVRRLVFMVRSVCTGRRRPT